MVLVVSGCKTDTPETSDEGPYIGGNKGLSLSFERSSPPSEFAEDDSVSVLVNVLNEGEYEVTENVAQIQIFGLSPSEFQGLNFDYISIPTTLYAAEEGLYEVGGEAIVDMGTVDYTGVISQQFNTRTINTRVCYPYQTRTSVEACITSGRIEDLGGEDICDYEDVKLSSGMVSSGPVQITSFGEKLAGINQVKFEIGFENKGEGEAYKVDSECGMDLITAQQNKNKVHVKVLPEEVSCRFYGGETGNEGDLVLIAGEEKILDCTMEVEQETKYTQGVAVLVDYKYIDSVSKEIKILGNQ